MQPLSTSDFDEQGHDMKEGGGIRLLALRARVELVCLVLLVLSSMAACGLAAGSLAAVR